MARVSFYLNFQGQTEEAFALYAEAFNSEVSMLQRFSEVPQNPEAPLPDDELNLIMHAEMTIMGGAVLMATDMLKSMGHQVRIGNNTTINLEPDTLEEAQRIYDVLSVDSTEGMPIAPMFWGAHWGVLLDKYGIRWMFNVAG